MKKTKLNKKGKSTVSQLRNKCDKLLQENGRKQRKRCEVCNNSAQVLHHFVPKSVSSRLRYDWDNLIFLCNSCHFKHHTVGDPKIHARIIDYRGKGWYEELELARREYTKCNKGYYENILIREQN